MNVFAVRTYFNAHVLSFFEALLQIQTQPLLPATTNGLQQQQQQQRPASKLPQEEDDIKPSEQGGGMLDVGRHGPAAATIAPPAAAAAAGVAGGAPANNSRKSEGYRPSGGGGGGDFAANQGRCQFAHLRVSACFKGLTYGDLSRHLIAHGAMPLGLYRPAGGTKGSTLAYAHPNPSPHELE